MPQVRAKFVVQAKEQTKYGQEIMTTVKLGAVTSGSEENKEFFRYTPNARIELGTINEKASDALPLGAEVYVDFTVVEPAAE